MRSSSIALLTATALLAASTLAAQGVTTRTLDIYFIDVEGGQATLIVTPERGSFLIDAGFAADGTLGAKPGDPHQARDANRILGAARAAGIKQIDYLLITHFHPDHDGAVPELAQLIRIRTFIDHGSPNPDAEKNVPGTMAAFDAYAAVRRRGKHLQPKLGDRLSLGDMEATVLSSEGSTIATPLPNAGASNAVCHPTAVPALDPYENPRSTGILVAFGKFRFLDLGDLTGQPLFALVCPKDKIGLVDAYLVAHHGGPDAADPATFAAFKPRVAIMNNGLKKGGSLEAYSALHEVPRLEDVWQLHRSEAAGDQNFSADHIANLDETTSHWLKLTAHPDGSFRIDNPRTGTSKTYPPGH